MTGKICCSGCRCCCVGFWGYVENFYFCWLWQCPIREVSRKYVLESFHCPSRRVRVICIEVSRETSDGREQNVFLDHLFSVIFYSDNMSHNIALNIPWFALFPFANLVMRAEHNWWSQFSEYSVQFGFSSNQIQWPNITMINWFKWLNESDIYPSIRTQRLYSISVRFGYRGKKSLHDNNNK